MKNMKWIFIWIICIPLWCKIEATEIINAFTMNLIQEIPPGGIVIKDPGTYVFTKDIKWEPNGNVAAITILANDVILDMRERSLFSSTTSFKTIGISALGCKNLKIKDGKLHNLGLAGIQCTLCSDVFLWKVVVDGLNVNDTVNYTVPTGILTTLCSNVEIHKCKVKNLDVKAGSSAGIQISETLNSLIKNCKVKNLLNNDGSCTGIGHLLSINAVVEDCKLSQLQSKFDGNLNTVGHTAIGIIPTLSTNVTVTNCSIKNIIGCCDDAHGMSLFLCEGGYVKDCHVINVYDGSGPARMGAKATGIEIYANNVIVRDCSAKNILAINPGDKQATGFSVADSHNVEFVCCKAENVQVYDEFGNQSPEIGFGTGFGWAPDPRPSLSLPAVNTVYGDCIAKHCQVGFDSFFHINSVWDHITSIDNGIPILNQDNSKRILTCDACSECGCNFPGCYPTPLVVTLDNVASNNIFLNVKIKE